MVLQPWEMCVVEPSAGWGAEPRGGCHCRRAAEDTTGAQRLKRAGRRVAVSLRRVPVAGCAGLCRAGTGLSSVLALTRSPGANGAAAGSAVRAELLERCGAAA